jgi:membrane protein DedA with SNARE-associated domain
MPTLLAAYAGSMCGITLSYLIGRTAGAYLIHRYGRWIGITEEKYSKVHRWFERFGKWLLFFGYFIAGVRHLTGYAAGTTELDYRLFAAFAYTGAIVWASSFLTIGYFFGNQWGTYLEPLLDQYGLWLIFIVLGLLIFGYLGLYLYKKKIKKT